MKLRFTTPEGALRDVEIRSLSLPTSNGEITVWPHHADLVAALAPGLAKIVPVDGMAEEFAVGAGVAEVRGGDVHLLADVAEAAESLDAGQVEAAVARAKQAMQETIRTDDIAFSAAAATLERELARSRVVRRRAARHGMRMERPKEG
jgi:F-type H+-transporting ATPase subunit epsilon